MKPPVQLIYANKNILKKSTPVILATQVAEIRRIVVRSQPRANGSQDSILKKPITHKKSADGVAQGEGPEFKLQY
jgi:hypothetical protein